MTSINGGNAALTILQLTQPLAGIRGQSAADTILDIVSGKANRAMSGPSAASTAAPEATKGPREIGGTVSSEISKAQMSAMSAAGAATVNGLSYDDPLIAFTPTKASVENAEAFVGRLAYTLAVYSAQFDLPKVPSREEYMAGRDKWLANQIASGVDQKQIDTGLRLNFGEGGYERKVERVTIENDFALRQAKVMASSIGNFTLLLGQVFGKDASISKDQDGRLTLGTLDIAYGNGQKMLSYGEDGSLTTFNEDGSVRRTLKAGELGTV